MSTNLLFSEPSLAQGATYDMGLRGHMQRIYARMMAGVLTTAVTAYVIGLFPSVAIALYTSPLIWVTFFAPLAITMFGFNPFRMSSNALRIAFFAIAVAYGLSFSGIAVLALRGLIGIDVIFRAFLLATIMFAGLSIFGYVTKRNLTGLGTFAIMGMWGLLGFAVTSFVFSQFSSSANAALDASPGLENIISVISILVFSAMTAWYTQEMKELYNPTLGDEMNSRLAWQGALTLYVSFIALFQSILNLLQNNR